MIGAHQNLSGSRNLTTPRSGMIFHLWAMTFYQQPAYQIWKVSISAHYEDMKMGT